jgi:hypothetical protein
MKTALYSGIIAALSILLGTSVAFNILQLRAANEAAIQKDRSVVTIALETIRRKGTLYVNNLETGTINLEYPADIGTSTKRLELKLRRDVQIQRVRAAVNSTGLTTGLSIENISQKDLVIGEPAYIITSPTTQGKKLETTLIMVGDVLPR